MEEKQEQNVKIHYDDVMMTSSRTRLYLTLFRLGGGGGEVPASISTFENFVDV